MIYLDTSVALAHLLGETRAPPVTLWSATLVSSRLLAVEMWVRINARGLQKSHGDAAQRLLSGVGMIELSAPVLERAMQPFPAPVRSLDALHLASIELVRRTGQTVELATYDERLVDAARVLRIPLAAV